MVERARAGSIRSLPAVRAELEALLVPLNRAAARRVLGRLVREQQRLGTPSAPAPSPAPAGGALDTVIDTSVGAEALLAHSSDAVPGATDTHPDRLDSIPPFPRPPRLGSLMDLPGAGTAVDTEPEGVPLDHDAPSSAALDTESEGPVHPRRPSSPNIGAGVVLFFVILLVLAAAVFVLLRLLGR
jgi:hypothetical protein